MQRQVILDAINELANHPTAEEIYAHVAKSHPSISKATVYRNLSSSVESGEISTVGIIDGAMRFDHNIHTHFHFVCDKCRTLCDVPSFDLNTANFGKLKIKKIDLVLHGTCEKCTK